MYVTSILSLFYNGRVIRSRRRAHIVLSLKEKRLLARTSSLSWSCVYHCTVQSNNVPTSVLVLPVNSVMISTTTTVHNLSLHYTTDILASYTRSFRECTILSNNRLVAVSTTLMQDRQSRLLLFLVYQLVDLSSNDAKALLTTAESVSYDGGGS